MELVFAPRGILQIDGARITHKNFKGMANMYNREGERNFSLVIPDAEICDALIKDVNKHGVGWNVKIRDAFEDGEPPFMYLKVKVNFNEYGPNIYLISGDRKTKLTPETVGCIDDIYIDHVDLDISPSDSVVNGKPYRTAYLRSMQVVQDLTQDRFADHGYYEDEE